MEWFRNYLTNHQQFVCINDNKSTCKELLCGVPQGSLLGPLLFSICINDFDQSSKILSLYCLQMISNLLYSHNNVDNLINTVNRELIHVSNWIKANKLSINTDKTSVMLFSNTVSCLSQDILFDNSPIIQTYCIKFLGLFIDAKLSWSQHINYLCKLISINIGIISKLKYVFPPEVLHNIYNTYILPHLTCGILAWGNTHLVNIIFILQKRALRIIDHVDLRAHSNPLFIRHKTLKVNDIYLLHLGVFMYQFFQHELPNYFQSMFIANTSVHQYYTRHASDIHIPYTRSSFSQKGIRFQGAKFLIYLDNYIKRVNSRHLFKQKLKCILRGKYVNG